MVTDVGVEPTIRSKTIMTILCYFVLIKHKNLAGTVGYDPTTLALTVLCATYCATFPYLAGVWQARTATDGLQSHYATIIINTPDKRVFNFVKTHFFFKIKLKI